MVNFGIDFGSTYTTISQYREDTQILEAIPLMQGTPCIPSVVAKVRDKYEFASAAKVKAGKKATKLYSSFKMMIPEKNEEVLQRGGYVLKATEENPDTPEHITKLFLDYVLTGALERLNEKTIRKLVICAPEIWSDRLNTVDGRTILRDICKKFDYIKDNNIQVVSEPAAASAFFAHNYYMNTDKNFAGNILLIDYGGGTLDITLTNVSLTRKNDKSEAMEIKVLDRTGAGENEDGKVGKAGIVYMETLLTEAIKRAGAYESEEELAANNGKFLDAFYQLETELQSHTQEIERTFKEYEGLDDDDLLEELNELLLSVIEYDDEEIEISYGLMYEVYNAVIKPVLDEKLQTIIKYMEKNNIPYMDRNLDVFKIAIVGGFGNFYLVQKQIKDIFKFNTNDKRREGIITNKADCEKAISMGAALIASDVIGIKNTAPYSIGIWSVNPMTKQKSLNYAIKYKQDIEFDTIYRANGIDGKPHVIVASSGSIDKFLINFSLDDRGAYPGLLKPEYAKKLTNIITNISRTAVVGFSLDSSGVVTIHVFDYDIFSEPAISKESVSIELASMADMFEVVDYQFE